MKFRGLLALALLASATAFATPAAAQETAGDKVRMVIVYGDDAVPPPQGDEIVVVAHLPESDRYRIPEVLRWSDDPANMAWARRVEKLEMIGKFGTNSCSPAGAGGFTGCTQQLIDAAWRAKAVGHLIEADLADLGIPVPPVEASDLALDGDGLLGVLYVLEGSSLGSRLLYRRAEALGFSASYGARHLAHASGPESWRDFLGVLETQHELDLDEATAASLATFRAAEAAFAAQV